MIDWLQFGQQFQSAIVGVLGFGGVILTLRANAIIARDNRDAAHALAVRTVRYSLIEELKVIKNAYVEGTRKLRGTPPDQSSWVPTAAINSLFIAQIDKLGILTSGELEKVLGAYLAHQQANSQLEFLSDKNAHLDRWIAIPYKIVAL